MGALVEVRPAGNAAQHSRVAPARYRARRTHPRSAPRATQDAGRRRPAGVRAPRLAGPQRVSRGRRAHAVPPVALDTGLRLTDRGLAVAMALAVVVVIAAVVCIATTAVRVTAEPPGGGVVAASAAR